jgi:hypothetical protein
MTGRSRDQSPVIPGRPQAGPGIHPLAAAGVAGFRVRAHSALKTRVNALLARPGMTAQIVFDGHRRTMEVP